MPFGGALTAGLGSALLGGLAGAANTRPPSLAPYQHKDLKALLASLMPVATGTPTIDPVQQMLMYGQIAQGRQGADTGVTHALTSRGLGQSGLLGAGLIQNQNQATANQNTANLALQQQAIQLKQAAIQQLLQGIGISDVPGQSGIGGFLAGLAPTLAYSIQSQNLKNQLAQLTPQIASNYPGTSQPNINDIIAALSGYNAGGIT